MTTTPVLLSLHPRFADLVFSKLKLVELRRRFAQFAENREVFIYVTSPARILRGGFRVDHVWKGTPEDIWHEVANIACIRKPEFDDYYRGSNVAYALGIADVWEFDAPASLAELRERLSSFTVPQSWRYVKANEAIFFRQLREKQSGTRVANPCGDAKGYAATDCVSGLAQVQPNSLRRRSIGPKKGGRRTQAINHGSH